MASRYFEEEYYGFYSYEGIEQEMEDDVISSAEEGFMRGYLTM